MDDLCVNCRTTCKKCMQTQINAEKERERHRINRRIELLVFPRSSLLRTDRYSRSSPPFCYTDSAEPTNCSTRNPPIVRTESANCPHGLPRNTARKKLSFPCHVPYLGSSRTQGLIGLWWWLTALHDLVKVEGSDKVPVVCIHGHTVSYPTAVVHLQIGSWQREARVVVAPELPVPVLLG